MRFYAADLSRMASALKDTAAAGFHEIHFKHDLEVKNDKGKI